MFYFHEQKLLWVIFHLWDGDLLPEMQGCFISWWILLFLDQLLLLTNGLIKIHNFLSCLYLPGHKQTYSCCNQPCNSPPLVILPLWRASPGKTPTNKSNSFHPPKNQQKRLSVESQRVEKERECCTVLHTHTHTQKCLPHHHREFCSFEKCTHTHWRFGFLRDANHCKNKHHPRANTR